MARDRRTATDLRKELAHAEEARRSEKNLRSLTETEFIHMTKLRDLQQEQNRELEARLAVVSSDRDRLTATVEVLSRRLASPTAESNPTRAGWRHAASGPDKDYTNMKSEAPRQTH